tara:strand:- start:237 stop:392 length:156 start_codon:yes stop_codon:yes gene_type:complete
MHERQEKSKRNGGLVPESKLKVRSRSRFLVTLSVLQFSDKPKYEDLKKLGI